MTEQKPICKHCKHRDIFYRCAVGGEKHFDYLTGMTYRTKNDCQRLNGHGQCELFKKIVRIVYVKEKKEKKWWQFWKEKKSHDD